MRLLFDTNVLIRIEDPKVLTPELQELLALIRKNGHQILVHPSSFEDLVRDENNERKVITQSKFKGYPQVERQKPSANFLSILQVATTSNEQVDNEILFALYQNSVDFLVTEDQGIYKKAVRLGCDDRVLTINSALNYLKSFHERWKPEHNVLKHGPVSNLSIDDPFFDSLRDDYGPEFDKWFEKISREGRECWYYEEGGMLKALMIVKEEAEVIETVNPLPRLSRLKISTLKVDLPGSKIGELFLKFAFDYCMKNRIPEVYLTHYVKDNDPLTVLLDEFEFANHIHARNKNKNGEPEQVYVKSFVPSSDDLNSLDALRFAKKYYPLFKDAIGVKKFIVPIKPEFHNRLFPNYKRKQSVLTDYELTSFGNAIKKAYLCHASITKIAPGDILIFYRSDDEKTVSCFGVVEKTIRTDKADEIIRFVGKRTVYSIPEISKMATKPVLAILFRHHLNSPVKLSINQLRELGILRVAPQSIMEIDNNQYIKLKKGCEIT